MEAINPQWYELPNAWVDAIDIEEQGKQAIHLLRDMIVKRPTEYSRFKKLFYRAMNNKITLLPRQELVLSLAIEAKLLGITETTYVSEKLGINRFSAYKALKRAEERAIVINYQSELKMETFDQSMAIDSISTGVEIPMSEIDSKIYYDTTACPTMPYNNSCTGTAYVRFGLCPKCHEHFKDKKRYPDGIPDWVVFYRNSIRIEARKEARHALALEKYGTNIDVHEVA